MGFPENILSRDEKVIRKLNPHWMTVLVPALLGLVIVALAVVIVLLTPEESPWPTIDWVVIAIAIVLFLAFVLVPFLRWRTTHYVITTNRVVVRRGILSKSGKDIALSKITDVSFHQSLWDRMLRSGSLTIESAGDGVNEEFKNIPRSNEIQQLINRLVEDDVDRRGVGSADARQHMADVRREGQHPGADDEPAGSTAYSSQPGDHTPPPAEGRWETWDNSGAHPGGGPAPSQDWETPPQR
ncbi:PH domain-containing protein [Epidermidibacterium keratini]|uniref:PH domain-containing protein n=1 Tax=Epidermidibacterium keratini TaxID=1891644 RepID=A0A7L4YQT2_9ACTN|nr:PH domain-containing protein [Epidermidibacterium keratini]QHC01516.1 PH domain-containing protein [Epidermidibacterium keratini]